MRDPADAIFGSKFGGLVEARVADIELADLDFSLVAIRNFMDEAQWSSRPEGGTMLHMVKRF